MVEQRNLDEILGIFESRDWEFYAVDESSIQEIMEGNEPKGSIEREASRILKTGETYMLSPYLALPTPEIEDMAAAKEITYMLTRTVRVPCIRHPWKNESLLINAIKFCGNGIVVTEFAYSTRGGKKAAEAIAVHMSYGEFLSCLPTLNFRYDA